MITGDLIRESIDHASSVDQDFKDWGPAEEIDFKGIADEVIRWVAKNPGLADMHSRFDPTTAAVTLILSGIRLGVLAARNEQMEKVIDL